MDDDERINQQRENEINRLIESMGKADPIKGILTDDEILQYAGDSLSASEIRLKRGIGNQADKSKVHDDMYLAFVMGGIFFICFGIIVFIGDFLFGKILFFFILLFSIGYYIYVMYIKDYTDPQYKIDTSKSIEEPKISTNDELLLLFESKEKIAREMIERKFPAPQLTNSKFNSVLDNCREVIESQVEILNALTPNEKTKYEIDSRKKLIKRLITKVDDLTNELILSEENDIEEVIDEMDQLIGTVKDY